MASTKPARQRRTERVMTLHPRGKNGVRIERVKYDAMRRAILRCVPRTKEGIALTDLRARVSGLLAPAAFEAGDGVTWYLIAVKQDLEARGLIEGVPGAKPQRLRRARGRV